MGAHCRRVRGRLVCRMFFESERTCTGGREAHPSLTCRSDAVLGLLSPACLVHGGMPFACHSSRLRWWKLHLP